MPLLNLTDIPVKREQSNPLPKVVASGDVVAALEVDVAALEAANGTDHRTVTTNTTVVAADSVIFVDASAGAVAVTLTAVSERRLSIKKIDASANAVTISGSETIDGAASISLTTQWESVTLAGDGAWYII